MAKRSRTHAGHGRRSGDGLGEASSPSSSLAVTRTDAIVRGGDEADGNPPPAGRHRLYIHRGRHKPANHSGMQHDSQPVFQSFQLSMINV